MQPSDGDRGPVYLTQLVGRDEELRSLVDRIWDDAKLITVFGPPGVGKTRLAVEALHLASSSGLMGYFCDLFDARTEEDVATQVLRSIFSGAEAPKGDPREAVVAALAARGPTTLLILDNFEHLTRVASDLISKWASACEGTTIVVTSRELLHIPGEVAFELAPLAVPASPDAIETTAATSLLLDAIHRYQSGARFEGEHRELLRDLAQRLDGLPLALEIVAPRVALLGLSLVHEQLDRILASPQSLSQGAGRSRRSLRESIAWSWALLNQDEQATLAQCTVFRGGFTAASLQGIVDQERAPRVLDVLMSLREKSLVHSYPSIEGELRFSVYSSISQFAGEQLDALSLRAETEARHRTYFAQRARSVSDERSPECLKMVRSERANLIAALACALSGVSDGNARTDALTLVPLLSREVTRASDPLAGLIESTIKQFAGDDLLFGHALFAWARMCGQIDHHEEAHEASTRALAIARTHSARALEARVLVRLTHLAPDASSEAILEASLAAAKESGDQSVVGSTLARMALVRCNEGAGAEALKLANEAVRCARYPIDIATNRSIRSLVLLSLGDLAAAEIDMQAALAEAERNGLVSAAAHAAGVRSYCLHITGPLQEAEAAYRTSIARYLECGLNQIGTADSLFLALVLLEENLVGAALEELRRVAPLLDAIYDPVRPPALASAIGELARARLAEAPVNRALFRTSEVGEFAAVLERLDILADVEDAHREMTAHPERAREMAQRASDRFAALKNAPKKSGSLERALTDAIVVRALSTWRNPLPDSDGKLSVHARGDWFRVPGGMIVVCSQRPVLRRLLAALAQARQTQPGTPLDSDGLREVAWPGERMAASSARNRLKQSMAMLRKLGLQDLLERKGSGYALASSVPFALEHGWRA